MRLTGGLQEQGDSHKHTGGQIPRLYRGTVLLSWYTPQIQTVFITGYRPCLYRGTVFVSGYSVYIGVQCLYRGPDMIISGYSVYNGVQCLYLA